jgi:hypothetical protein
VAYVIVLFAAAAVGGGVYYLTIRRGLIPLPGFETEAPAPPTSPTTPTGSSYVSTGAKPDWQSRMTGVLGLAVTVIVGAVALASSLYLSVSWIVRIVGHASKSD